MKNKLLRVYLGLQYISCVLWVFIIAPLFYFFCFEQDCFSIGYLVEMLDISPFWQFMLSAYIDFIISALLLAVPTVAFFKSINVTKKLISAEKLNFKDKALLFPWAFAVLYFVAVILLWLLCGGVVFLFNEIFHLLKSH